MNGICYSRPADSSKDNGAAFLQSFAVFPGAELISGGCQSKLPTYIYQQLLLP